MKKDEFLKMYKLEQSHWWFVGKRKLIKSILNKYIKSKNKNKTIKLLDAGCGTGIILKLFKNYGTSYGLDVSNVALKFCRKREIRNIKKASIEKIPYPNNYFDVVGCFDVLYHKDVKDYKIALKEIYRVCKPNGLAIINDAAFEFLKSKHDLASGTMRRFNKKQFRRELKNRGFKIKKLSYFNMFLFPIILIKRKVLDPLFNDNITSDIKETNKFMNTMLISLLNLEIKLISKLSLPFGVSIFCVARK